MNAPIQPKIYHIVHVDRLPSIIASNGLWCDAEMAKYRGAGTMIGMDTIKPVGCGEARTASIA
jgi:hypothetical protein